LAKLVIDIAVDDVAVAVDNFDVVVDDFDVAVDDVDVAFDDDVVVDVAVVDVAAKYSARLLY